MFASLFVVEAFVFTKLSWKMDSSGILTLLSYLTASFLRILPNMFKINIFVRAILEFVTSYLVVFVIYYFTFEILKIEASFKGRNPA